MNQELTQLWEKIRAFPLDEPGAAFGFTRRLARENGWAPEKAQRVIEEYKKFIFLAMAAGHPVSPSDEVDQAWHLHMLYTRSYWEKFCRDVLGRPFHHEPTRGGAEEQKKFDRWYRQTLESYRAFFRREPPSEIWPAPGAHTEEDSRFERANLARSVLLPRAWIRGASLLAGAALLVALLIGFGGRFARSVGEAMNLPGGDFLGLYFLMFLAVVAGGFNFRAMQRKPDDDPVESETRLHPYEAAYLAGGENQAANAALASLVGRGVLGAVPAEHRVMRLGTVGKESHPLEGRLCGAASVKPGSEVSALHLAAFPELEKVRLRLVSLGLWVSEGRDFAARAVPVAVVIVQALFGVAKVCIGADRHRPVGFLILFILASLGLGLWFFLRPLGRSRRGDRALERMKDAHRELKAKAAHAEAGMTPLEVPMAAALFGVAALGGGPYDSLKATLHPPPGSGLGGSGGGGCGSGGGCGGGGCGGGGCGGCGGCGGGG